MVASPSQLVDYFHSSYSKLPTTPPSVHSSSPNPDHLAARSSPQDDTDPPPFVPSPDDHVSLNQFEGLHPALHDGRVATMTSRKPRMHRSTSSIRHEALLLSSRNTPRAAPTYRGRSRTEHSQRRRPISVPGKRRVRMPARPLWPSPTDGSKRASESGQGDHNPKIAELSNKSSYSPTIDLEGPRRIVRAGTHPIRAMPSEIRLRRASDKAEDSSRRRSSLPALPHVSSSSMALTPSNKAAPVGTALTQAYVHMFLPKEQFDERRSSTPDGHRRLSATLQVVRSRDSVYEVIWEDIAAIEDTPSTTSSSSSSSLGVEIASHFNNAIQAKSGNVKTDLASWSWGGELEPYSKAKTSSRSGRPSKPSRSSLKKSSHPGVLDLQIDPAVLPSAQINSNAESSDDLLNSTTRVNDLDAGYKKIPERPSRLPRPPLAPSLGTALSVQRQSEVLGKRKISSLPPEQDHFTSHRDSIILAHERMLNKKSAKRPMRAERMRPATWEKLKAAESKVKYSQLEQDSSYVEPFLHAVKFEVADIDTEQANTQPEQMTRRAKRKTNRLCLQNSN